MVKGISVNQKSSAARDLKVSCKLAKRAKNTSKKLIIDTEKLVKTIKFFKRSNLSKVKELSSLFYYNIYAYLSFKQPLPEKIKKAQIKLSSPLIDSKNKLKICIVTDSKDENLEVKLLESLTTKEDFKGIDLKSLIEIIDFKEFTKLVKSNNNALNLNYFYHQFIIENKYFGRIKKLLGKNIHSLDIILFNNISKDYERESKLIFSSINCSKITNIYKNKLFKIKVANCSQTLGEIYKNIKLNIYRTVAFLLTKSAKHNNIENITLKTENSAPVSVYKDINPEELIYIDNVKEEEGINEEEEVEEDEQDDNNNN